MVATINAFAIPVLSLAIAILCSVVMCLNRKLQRLEKPPGQAYLDIPGHDQGH